MMKYERGESMIVEEIMKKDVITLKENDTILTALKLLNRNCIRHIPIVDDENHVIGIVSDRDIRDASPSIFQKSTRKDELRHPIGQIMSKDVITVHPLDFVEEVSAIFYEEEIACIPVTKDDKLVGVITEKDMLHTLIQLTGAIQPGSQIEIKVPNVAGILSKVATVIGKRNINIHSVLVYPYVKDSHYKILVFRIQTMNPAGVIQDLNDEGYTVLWPNTPGMTI